MKTAKEVLKYIKDNDVKYVDLPLHRPARQVAARHLRPDAHRRREIFTEGIDVRRFVDRRLEGDQRVRHGADARSDHRDDGPVLRRPTWSIVCDVLEPSTGEPYNRDPRGIAKKAGSLHEVAGRRRHRLFRSPKPNSSCSTTCASTDPLQHGLRKLDSSNCRPTTTPTMKAATSATASAPRRLFPGPADGLGAGHAPAKCSARWRRWASRSRSTTTKSRPPSTSSA